NLADGNPDHGLLPDLGIALRTIAADHVRYGQDPIDERLGRLFVADLSPDLAGHRGHDVIPGETLAVVAGALDGIERTLAAHLRPGDRVGVEDPGYAAVIQLVKALNLRPVAVPIDDAGPQPEGVADALAQGIRALIVTPRAQNPTGAAITADRAAILADLLADHPDVLLIEDDHAGPVAGAPYHSLIPAAADRWAVIRSVAKSLGPDLRLAALVADRTTHGRVANRQLLGTGWVSHLLQRTVAALLDPMGPAPAPADRFVTAAETYRARRAHLLNALDLHGIPATGPSGLNVWVPVPDEGAVVAALQQRGYAVLAGARFRLLSGPAIRISTGSATEVQLDGVANALGEALATGPAGRSV
ncbi:MAG: aminotransferase class I/II-fold pyridoxal phosphate-dependent enzyme, partial [Actinomycetota bacterium]